MFIFTSRRPAAAKTFAAAAFVALALAGCDSAEERAEKHFTRGVALAERGEPEKARLEFRNVLRLNEDHAPTRFEVARLYEAEGELRAAFSNYRRVLDIDAGHVPARVKIAQFYMAAGELEEAREAIDRAFVAAPDDVEVLSTKAAISYRLGDTDAALGFADRVLARDPDDVGANLVHVTAMIDRGARDEAMATLDELIGRNRQERAYSVIKLRLLAERDDREGLERHLRMMTETFPDEPALRQSLVRLYVATGDVSAAEAELRAMADDDPAMVIELVRFIGQARGEDAARAEIEAQIAAAEGDAAFDFELILVALDRETGRIDAARQRLERLAAAQGATDAGDRARIELARLARAADDDAAARALVDAVLERDDGNVDALALRADMMIGRYESDEAIVVLRRARNLAPDDVTLMLLEARAHERSGNASLAGERLAAAARTSDFAPEIALRYAAFLRARGQDNAAETVLSESARRNRSDTRLLSALAELRLRLGDLIGVEEVAGMLRALDDGQALGDRVTAAVLARQGRDEESIGLLERAVGDPAGRDSALAGLIAGYVRAGQVARAEAFLDELIAENPANQRALILRAEVHLLQGEVDAAATRLEAAVAAAPEDFTSYLVLARFETARGDAAQAETILRDGLEVAAEPSTLRLMLAGMLEARGAFDEAIEQYTLLYENNPESVVVANNLASLLAEFREDDVEAIAFATRVARRLRASTVPHFLDTYAWVRFLAGDVDEALRSIAPAAEQLPNNALVRYHAGRILAAAGESEAAREHLVAALAIDPDFPKAASARAALDALPQGGG